MFGVQQRDKENMKGTLLDYISMLTFGFAEETCVLMWKRFGENLDAVSEFVGEMNGY